MSVPHIRALESESIYILREAASQFSRSALLYSIGKDSSVLLHLAQKARRPGLEFGPGTARALEDEVHETRRFPLPRE